MELNTKHTTKMAIHVMPMLTRQKDIFAKNVTESHTLKFQANIQDYSPKIG